MNSIIVQNIIRVLKSDNISDKDIEYYIFDIDSCSDINLYKDIDDDILLKDYYEYLNNPNLIFDIF